MATKTYVIAPVLQTALRAAGERIREATAELAAANDDRQQLLTIVATLHGSDSIDEVSMRVFVEDEVAISEAEPA
jgi:hypothetical protein